MTSEEKKTKEQNINEVQSLLGGLIGLPERDRAWTSPPPPVTDSHLFLFEHHLGFVRRSEYQHRVHFFQREYLNI